MVLSGFGRQISEAKLRELCDCTPFGTEALNAVDAARRLGFSRTGKYTLSLFDLETLINEKMNYPIVYVDTLLLDGVRGGHSLVVIATAQDSITVYDPLREERNVHRATFSAAWAMMHNLAIVVKG